MSRQCHRCRSVGLFLTLLGSAAMAFGLMGFSVVALAILLAGAVTFVFGLYLFRPTGRMLLWLFVAICFVTLSVWLLVLFGSLVD